jgi:hypothetical protein
MDLSDTEPFHYVLRFMMPFMSTLLVALTFL